MAAPSLYSICSCTINSLAHQKNTRKKSKHLEVYQNTKPKLPFPKSLPTPLLTNHKTQPQTKLQALDAIIDKLESTTKNGIKMDDDPQIFASLLETCHHLQAIDQGTRVHHLIPDKLLRKNTGISSKLVRLYACNGDVEKAHQLFDNLPKCNQSVFTWNSLISGYVDHGLYEDALALYFQMVEEGLEPDRYTLPRVLKSCGGIGLIQVGEEIHRHVTRYGFGNDTFVMNALVDMYAKCGDIVKARKLFNMITNKDLVSWNSMLTGYIKHGLFTEGFHVFSAMLRAGYEPDSITISTLLTSDSPFNTGTQIHSWVIHRGMEQNLSINNALIVFYSKQGKLEKARRLFELMQERDIVSWNSIISAHSKQAEAIEYFELMMNSNISPDGITFVSLLSACAHLGMVKDGERFFTMMKGKYGINPVMEHYACMVNLYARAGLISEGYEFIISKMEFEGGPTVWGALLYGCVLHGNVDIGEIAGETLFELEPDNEHNFELLMKIYRNAGLLDDAKRVQVMMVERGLDFSNKFN